MSATEPQVVSLLRECRAALARGADLAASTLATDSQHASAARTMQAIESVEKKVADLLAEYDSTKRPQSLLPWDLCHDFGKKLSALRAMPADKRKRVASGVAGGLLEITVAYPNGDAPEIRPSFDPDYEAGYDVAETWARLASLLCRKEGR